VARSSALHLVVTNAIVLVESLRLEMYASVTDDTLHNCALNRDTRRYNDDKINAPQYDLQTELIAPARIQTWFQLNNKRTTQ